MKSRVLNGCTAGITTESARQVVCETCCCMRRFRCCCRRCFLSRMLENPCAGARREGSDGPGKFVAATKGRWSDVGGELIRDLSKRQDHSIAGSAKTYNSSERMRSATRSRRDPWHRQARQHRLWLDSLTMMLPLPHDHQAQQHRLYHSSTRRHKPYHEHRTRSQPAARWHLQSFCRSGAPFAA